MKDCGSCYYFTKIKNDNFSSGICELYDSRANTDDGKNCNDFKHKKYKRIKNGKNNVKTVGAGG